MKKRNIRRFIFMLAMIGIFALTFAQPTAFAEGSFADKTRFGYDFRKQQEVIRTETQAPSFDPITSAAATEAQINTDLGAILGQEESQVQASTYAYGETRRYTAGNLIDGGVYRLKNVRFGSYLTASGSSLTYASANSGTTQYFKINYLGRSKYDIQPYGNENQRIGLTGTALGSEAVLNPKTLNNAGQRFILFNDTPTTISIVPENGSDGVCLYPSGGKIYVGGSIQSSSCHWTFEYQFGSDSTQVFYLRNQTTGKYVDVYSSKTASGSEAGTYAFNGDENQRFKRVYDSERQVYYLKPMYMQDLALDSFASKLCVYTNSYPQDQGLKFEYIDFDKNFNDIYRISTLASNFAKFWNINPDGSINPQGTNANDLWVLEEVKMHSAESIQPELETWGTHSLRYDQTSGYALRSETDSRYKVELTRNSGNAIMGIYSDNNASTPSFCNVYNTENGQVFDVFLKAKKIYYIYIFDSNNNCCSFNLRFRRFTATYHSNTFPQDIDLILDSSSDMNLRVMEKRDMTAARARTETNDLTGNRDFNSEIFVYSGHGYNGYACYDGNSIFNYFGASELPSMSNCELAIWDCCNSATKFVVRSLVSESIAKGAKTVIGWKPTIYSFWSGKYVDLLFENLLSGMSVNDASVKVFADYNFTGSAEARTLLDGLVMEGNRDNVIFPVNNYSHEIQRTIAVSAEVGEEYSLIGSYQNDCVKLYSKTIGGIMTDDFKIVYYRNGFPFKIYKSPYTLTDQDKALALSRYGNRVLPADDLASYRWFNGELRLVEKLQTLDTNGDTKIDFVDFLTRERVEMDEN